MSELIVIGSLVCLFSPFLLIWISKGFKRSGDLQKEKKTTFVQLCITIGLVAICYPLANFIGVMATDSPSSTMVQFWEGFFFIEGVPLLGLLLTSSKLIKQFTLN